MIKDDRQSPHYQEASTIEIAPLPRISIQAFCLTQSLTDMLDEAANDRRMARVQTRIQTGGISAAIEAFRIAPTPNLIVIEFRADEVDELPFALDQLAQNCDVETRVILVGPVNDVQLYRESVRRGVSDYLVFPLSSIDLIAAFSDLFRIKMAPMLGRCVAFMPAKGGSGSSTLSHNASWMAGAKLSLPVILVDTDLPFGTAALNVNQDPINGLADVLFAQERPDPNMIERSLCKISDMVSLLAAASNLERALDITPSALDDAIDALRTMAPLVIFDLPHQWSGWVQRVVAECDDIIIVAEPDLASLKNAKQIIEQAMKVRTHDRKPALVLNKVGIPKRPEIPAQEFFKALDVEEQFLIPFDANIFGTAANNGQMLMEAGASASLEKTLLELARFVAKRPTAMIQKKKPGLSDILNRFVAFRR